MSRATILQAAAAVIVAGLLFALAGAPRRSEPTPIRWRPATEQEQQQRQEQRLYEELLRQQQRQPSATP